MNKSDLIEKYIRGEATAEEREQVNRLMREDTDFKKSALFQIELRQAVRREENRKLKQHLQSLDRKRKNTFPFPRILKIAAVVIIGLGLMWLFKPSSDAERLFAKNFKPYPNIVIPAVRAGSLSDGNREKAFRYYDEHNYAMAAAAFEALREEEGADYANFYRAISLMADHQVEEAIELLANLNQETPDRFKIQTDWYLALGYLKTGDKEKAIKHLNRVITADGAMATQAKEIIARIK